MSSPEPAARSERASPIERADLAYIVGLEDRGDMSATIGASKALDVASVSET